MQSKRLGQFPGLAQGQLHKLHRLEFGLGELAHGNKLTNTFGDPRQVGRGVSGWLSRKRWLRHEVADWFAGAASDQREYALGRTGLACVDGVAEGGRYGVSRNLSDAQTRLNPRLSRAVGVAL